MADVTFAVDSIPAAFAITRDAAAIWIADAAALLGLTSLFVLVRALVERFRFMSQTLAAVLVFIAVRLLLEDPAGTPTASLPGAARGAENDGRLRSSRRLTTLSWARWPPPTTTPSLRGPGGDS